MAGDFNDVPVSLKWKLDPYVPPPATLKITGVKLSEVPPVRPPSVRQQLSRRHSTNTSSSVSPFKFHPSLIWAQVPAQHKRQKTKKNLLEAADHHEHKAGDPYLKFGLMEVGARGLS